MAYQSITVVPGQTAYIPTNAVVIGISQVNGGNITSTCLNLNNVQQFTCYVMKSFSSLQSDPDVNVNNVFLESVEVSGVTYPGPRSTPGSGNGPNGELSLVTSYTAIVNWFATNQVFNNIVLNMCFVANAPEGANRGENFYYVFQTLPSIGEAMVWNVASFDDNTAGGVYYQFPIIAYSTLKGYDTSTLCGCALPTSGSSS